MTASPSPAGGRRGLDLYHHLLRQVVRGLAWVAGAGLLVMVLVTTVDVLLRVFRLSMTAPTIVKIAAAVTMAAALPYTTAIKATSPLSISFTNRAGADGGRGRVSCGCWRWRCSVCWRGDADYGNFAAAEGRSQHDAATAHFQRRTLLAG